MADQDAKQKDSTAVSTATKRSTTAHSTTKRTIGDNASHSRNEHQRPKIEEIIHDDDDDEAAFDDEEDEDEEDSDLDSDSSDIEEIDDPEKWRIIKESGVLEKVRTNNRTRSGRGHHHGEHKEVGRDYIFEGIFFSIPTTCLFVVMDILVHRQFGEDYGSGDIFRKIVKAFPAILIMVYFSNKAKNNKLTQASMFVISIICGCYFLHTMFRSPAMGIMLRAPGIITILVYCIVQLDLFPAVISLALCGLYYKFGNVKYPTKMPAAIFLDSGGVINDNKRRAPQWLRYLGEFLPTTVFGGTAEIWSNANRQVAKTFFARWHEYMVRATQEATQLLSNHNSGRDQDAKNMNVAMVFERIHLTEWMRQMCECAAESLPELKDKTLPNISDQELYLLGKQAYVYAQTRVRAAFPGAVDTIRQLSAEKEKDGRKRYRLFTSSGDSSEDLEIILKGIDVFDYFEEVFGSDRVNCLKMSPRYYERVFESVHIRVETQQEYQVGTNAEEDTRQEVVVVDDSEKALQWAHSLGAITIIIGDEGCVDLSLPQLSHVDYRLSSL
ncbi:hypothetical protein BG004_006657, partial [Podila humilis]